jgi:NADPH:quinone reductase-like Zn-dependent oxidoreductase
MSEQDVIARLERDVVDLRVANASLASSVEHLALSVKALTETVTVLRDTMNQGKGALWLIVAAAGGVGAAITMALKQVFSNP